MAQGMNARGALARTRHVWGALDPRQRLAAIAALALFGTMFLPWYTKNTSAIVAGRLQKVEGTLIAWQAFSFVEAAVLIVAVATLVLLWARAEDRAFHLPGGDGTVITAGGVWVCLLVFYRQLDKPNGTSKGQFGIDYGVTWGIFVTFLVGALLAYAGWHLRAAHLAEPPLPAADATREAPTRVAPTAQTRVAPSRRPEPPPVDGGEQLTFEDR